jgi:hypothetical protein
MTSVNLNRDYNTILLDRYEEDYKKDDLQFPVRYLLFDAAYKLNLIFELPNKVEPTVFKRNLLYYKINRTKDEPRFSNDVLNVYPNREQLQNATGSDAASSSTIS